MTLEFAHGQAAHVQAIFDAFKALSVAAHKTAKRLPPVTWFERLAQGVLVASATTPETARPG